MAIAMPGHWFKNIFMLSDAVLALTMSSASDGKNLQKGYKS